MDEKTLILEGLPVELDMVRSKLELYFKNRRKSGGEVLQIREHPEDKQKALLVYTNENDFKTILKKGTHQIDFKPQGIVDLTVKLPEVSQKSQKKEKNKPRLLFKPSLKPLKYVQAAQPTVAQGLGSNPEVKELGSNPEEGRELADMMERRTADILRVQENGNKAKNINGNKDNANEESEIIRDLIVSTMEEIDKETLTMYFEQFTDQAEMIKHGKNSWILKVVNQSDVSKILAQKEHDFGVCVEVYKEASGSENWDPRRFILTGFKDTCSCKVITVFIGSCSQKAENTWEIVDDERIVVTFKEDIDVKAFLNKCAAKSNNLRDMEIGVSRLELTDSVLVQGDMSQINKDMLTLYFSNKNKSGGGEITSLNWVTKPKSVVISFQDCQDAQEVIKRNHVLCNKQLSTLPFYSSLGKSLTGQRPTLSDTTKISIPVDNEVRSFIERNEKCKKDFQQQLKKVQANVIYDISSTSQIILEMSLDKESLAATRLGTTWESKAKTEAQSFLRRYHKAELAVKVEIWKRIERDCLELVSLGAEISYVETQCKIAIVGLREVTDSVMDKIKHILKDASAKLEVERNTAVKVIQFSSEQKLELVETCVHPKLANVFVTKDKTTLTLHLKGLKDNVSAAERVIKQAKENVVFQRLNPSAHMLQFLKSLQLKKFEQNHFFANHTPALFYKSNGHFGILAGKENVQKAKDILTKILKEEIIPLAPNVTSVDNNQNWVNFLSALKADVDLSCNAKNVHIIQSEAQKLVICGFAQLVTYLSQKVKDYLQNKTPETIDIHLKSLQEVEFVESCMSFSEVQELRNLGLSILLCKSLKSPCLKITAAKEKIQSAATAVRKHISSIIMEKQTYSKAGASKVIQKHIADINAKTKDWGCKAFIIKEYTYQINSQISLTVAQDDLLSLKVDALVCPMDSQLAFNNPIAQKFLQAGGPMSQSLCSVFKKEKQTLLAGEVACSDSGNLNAKTLIYAGLPQSDHFLRSQYLNLAVFNSLQKANAGNYVSIAMPAMGCKSFGFSIKESCMAIREAVLKFSNDQMTQKNLRNIFVVDPDVNVVETFNNLLAELGFSDVQTSTSSKVTTFQEPLQGLNPKQASGTEVIVHGVLVTLKQGDISKEMVDVIVNSTNCTLDLGTGVSGAILKAAGKQVVDECKQHGSQKSDGVVLTSGGNLLCKHIAHMVGPSCAADIKASIRKVLNLCESKKAATVAIPAIGTGRGSIGANKSIEAIVSGVEKHLSYLQSSSLKKITVVPFEQTAFDAFSSFFKVINNRSYSETSQAAQHSLPANQVKIAGVRIEVKKGTITNETVRGIVNTTNDQMNLTGGVSGAIFKAAGPSVAQECQYHGPIRSDTVAVTSGGNLQCDFIIHMMGPHTSAEARLRVKKALEQCEEKQISTISFPAVGTGGGGLTGVQSINAMLQGFKDHLTQRCFTAIKLIYVVVSQDELLKEVLQGLKQWTSEAQEEKDLEDERLKIIEEDKWYYGSGEEGKEDDCSANITDVLIGPVNVKVLCGDITKEMTEAIVNSTNTSLNLSSGVSAAILEAAGQTVVKECNKLGIQPGDGVVITGAGKLPTKNIVHMVGQTSEMEITRVMYKVLKKCEENMIRSVSFPALGTGAGNLAAAQVANAMLNAVSKFTTDSPRFLKSVQIVIFQSNMLPDFSNALKNFKKVSPKPFSVTNQTFTPNIKPTTCLATETAAVTFPVTTVAIYGTSSTDIAKVKKFLDDLISEECTTEDVVSSHLANLSETEKKEIMTLSLNNQVHVRVASKEKLIVSGKKDDVLDVVRKIEKIVREARDREVQKGEEKRLGEILCWQIAEGETWQSLGPSISYQLELAFHKKVQSFTYQDKGETYTVNFKEMKCVNTKGRTSTVKRTLFGDADTAIIQPPATWTKMDGKDLEIVTLPQDSEEYKRIKQQFECSSKYPSVSPVQVVQIQRIQSQSQWQKYSVQKQAVDKKYPNQNNEQFLYHGTTKAICEKINKNGFNRSFCGRNAVVHGDGTYFAKESWYSCQDQYSNPDRNGLKYIYRARVVTGLPCRSRSGMKEPDPLDPNDPQAGLYDCAVDNLHNPFIFVVFFDAGAYPDYLITFKNVY
ncbi:protein mono-ADP-ribosyltransferase PARP14 [Trichomycterus rosablanca]|uniref:protein mono-ADP-ribosyltransferase PARP14 n=1 Tax=Trichomycterus rosablanca TaxID=2290929 RepID=UPI002F34FFC0